MAKTTGSTQAQKDGQMKNGRMARRMFRTSNDLEPQVREQMVDLLNRQLAGTFDLFSQTKQAHWNVKGAEFYQLHELYDELAGGLIEFVDVIAERATALGGEALGTVRMAAESSELEEYPREAIDSLDTVRALAERYAALGRSTREAIEETEQAGDMDTNDLFIDVSRFLDKSLWFLEAHLQEKGKA